MATVGEPGQGTEARLTGLRSRSDMGPFAVGLCSCRCAVEETGDEIAVIATAEAVACMLLFGLIIVAFGDMACCLTDDVSWEAALTGEATDGRRTTVLMTTADGEDGGMDATVPFIAEALTGESASSVSGDGTGRRKFGELGEEFERDSLAPAPWLSATPFDAGCGTKGTAPALNVKSSAAPLSAGAPPAWASAAQSGPIMNLSSTAAAGGGARPGAVDSTGLPAALSCGGAACSPCLGMPSICRMSSEALTAPLPPPFTLTWVVPATEWPIVNPGCGAGTICACTSGWSSCMPWAKVHASAFRHQPWMEKWLQSLCGTKWPGKRRAGIAASICGWAPWAPWAPNQPGGACWVPGATAPSGGGCCG
mmetsp:Transcript_33476/g.93958  ORF Transcript_33476/g.93958 Transcript_33476/m.93958 type:complete len:366 (-) Transcript_33476:167-1264(-)